MRTRSRHLPNGPTKSTAKRSKIFEIGDIVRVPFPFVERERLRARPALVVSLPVGPDGLLLWSLMITAAQRGRWPGDIDIGPDHQSYGLPVPCVIRTAKVIAFEARAAERRLGRISGDMLCDVQMRLSAHLALRHVG